MLNNKRAVLCLGVSAIGWTCSTAFTTTRRLPHCTVSRGLSSPLFAYDDGSYSEAGYSEAGYSEAGYSEAGYSEAGYSEAGYSEGGYDDGSYSEAGYTEENNDLTLLRDFLQRDYPDFFAILDKNEEIWKAVADTEEGNEPGFTVFLPSLEALQKLGPDKLKQMMDDRNLETTQKIAAYHVIGEPVTAEALFEAGGVLTVGGEVPIERATTGGFFGIGGTEDGSVTLNKANVLRSGYVGNGLVHEVDNLVSPNILWRFMDQLRIPGSN